MKSISRTLGIVKGCSYEMQYNVIQDNDQLFIVTKLSRETSHTPASSKQFSQPAKFFLKGLEGRRS